MSYNLYKRSLFNLSVSQTIQSVKVKCFLSEIFIGETLVSKNSSLVKEKIIQAAMKVFAKYGFFKAPVRLIAEQAGVSKGLIFWYFRSKDELIKEVAKRSLPIDIIEECLNTNLRGKELLRYLGKKYLNKYSDRVMKLLLLHTFSIMPVYPYIKQLISEKCNKLLEEIAKRVYGNDGISSKVKIRVFLGGLLCYILHELKEVDRDTYVNELINLLDK